MTMKLCSKPLSSKEQWNTSEIPAAEGTAWAPPQVSNNPREEGTQLRPAHPDCVIMRSRIEGRSSIGSEGQEDSKDGTRSSISGSLSRPSIVTTTPMMFSNMSMRRRTSDDSGDNFRGVDYDYEHRRNESFLMSEVLPSRVQRLLERRSSQYSDRSSISAQNAAARPSNNAFSPSRANVSRSPFSQMRNDVEAIAFDFEKNNNASRRRGAATHTIQEGRAIAITSESSMDKKFEDFVNSEAYKRTEGIVSRKDDRIRDSRDYNDDTYDYAIVVVLGMPQTVKPHGIEKIPEVQSHELMKSLPFSNRLFLLGIQRRSTIKGSADENKSPSNFSKTKAERYKPGSEELPERICLLPLCRRPGGKDR
eukprot:jgi/Bigna1/76409/fgenesh1_pg.41_\